MAGVRRAALTAALTLTLAATTLLGASRAQASPPRLVGVSAPALGTFPSAEVVRIFLQDAKTFTESRPLAAIPTGKVIIVSFRTVPTLARWRTVLSNWQGTGRRIWWVYRHEANLPGDPITPTQYKSTYAQLLSVGASHSGNVHGMTVLSGDSVRTGDVVNWYVPGVQALGFDIYYLDNLPRAQAYARSKGKPMAIPEWGDGTQSGVGWQGDDKTLAFAKQYIAALDSTTFAACWWSVGHNDLSLLPKTLAYLRSLT